MPIEAHSKEFDEGWDAFEQEKDFVKDNPYKESKGSKEYDDWRDGFMAAEDNAEKEEDEDEEEEEEDDNKSE